MFGVGIAFRTIRESAADERRLETTGDLVLRRGGVETANLTWEATETDPIDVRVLVADEPAESEDG